MFWLFRRFCTLLGFLVLCGMMLYLGRNWAAQTLLQWVIPHYSTFQFRAEQVEILASWPMCWELREVRLLNPADFEEEIAMNLPRARLLFSPHLWGQGAIQLTKIELEISAIYLSGQSAETSNFQRFYALSRSQSEGGIRVEVEKLEFEITDPQYAHTRTYTGVDSLKKFADALRNILTKR
jgi:hypothetical protein